MISTQRSRLIRPPTTPPSWSRSTRSSTPGRPLGILRKSPTPSSFWPWKSNGQWSVATSWRSSLTRPRPQVVPGLLRPQRRGADELGALEPVAHVVERQEEVLRARLGEGHRAAVARGPDLREGVARGQVDDVDRHAGGLGEADDAVGRLALEDGLAREAVADRIGRARVDGLGRDDVDGHPVLGVHHDQAAVLRGLLHRPEDRPVVAVEDARVGGEELEVRDALGDQRVHLLERVVVDVAHDHVEAVVGDGVALGLGHPRVEALAQRRPLAPGPRSRRSRSSRRTPRRASRSRRCPWRTSRRTAAPCACGRRCRPGSRTCRSRRWSRRRSRRGPACRRRWRRSSRRRRGRRRAYEPSAVTMVPLVMSVRIGPSWATGVGRSGG